MIPESLAQQNLRARGNAGRAWAERLPATVMACAARWGLRVESPYPGLSYNYAAPVWLPDGGPAALKVCFPDHEFCTEAAALRHFDGDGYRRCGAWKPRVPVRCTAPAVSTSSSESSNPLDWPPWQSGRS